MRQYIRDAVADAGKNDPAGLPERLAREAWEALVLLSFYGPGESSPFIFKGGSALRLLYGSSRMSSDLDFDEIPMPETDEAEEFADDSPAGTSRKIASRLERARSFMEGFGFSDVVFSPAKEGEGTVRYKASAVAKLGSGAIKFLSKVEVSRRPARGLSAVAERFGVSEIETEMSFSVPPAMMDRIPRLCGTFVKTYTPLAIFLMKMAAVSSPSRVSTRDVYDMAYIWSRLGLGDESRRERMSEIIKTFVSESMSPLERSSFLSLFREKGERFHEDLERGADIHFYGEHDNDELGLFVLDFVDEFSSYAESVPEFGL